MALIGLLPHHNMMTRVWLKGLGRKKGITCEFLSLAQIIRFDQTRSEIS